jgi:epoxyqueuosine reductase QueG
MKEFGTAILLGTVVTEAKLDPTNPLPEEESFCDKCKLCVAACPSSMFSKDEETYVTLGGCTFKHSARKSYLPCQFVCGGFTGLHKSGKWSTWSPGRFTIPDTDDDLLSAMVKATEKYQKWPERKDGLAGYENPALAGMNLRLTCANCQLICWGNKEDTRRNYRLLTTSGCVIQHPDGRIAVLPSAEAQKAFEAMSPEHRGLYR